MTQTILCDLEGFCPTCPTAEEVTNFLQALGFHLAFQMDAITYPAYTQTPAMPAQYHYSDLHGTEVIYLAGRDANTDGVHLCEHASRFWVFPGADEAVYRLMASALAVKWRFLWRFFWQGSLESKPPAVCLVLEEVRP